MSSGRSTDEDLSRPRSPGEARRDERLRLRAQRLALRKQQGSARERGKGLTEDRIKQWRISAGPLTFFNCAPKHVHVPLVENTPMVAEVLRDGFVSAAEFHGRPSGADGPLIFSRAVYRQDGTIAPEFIEQEQLKGERGGKRMRNPLVVEPGRLARAKKIKETCVYLGDLKFHFGHFLLESLARAWYLKDGDPKARVIFHRRSDDSGEIGAFGHVIFRALGVDRRRLLIASEDLRVKNLILPRSQYLNTIKGSPGMCVGFDHIRDRILSSRPTSRLTPGKVYFTRRHIVEAARADSLVPGINAAPRRPLVNEDEAEAVFARLGFEIVAPETLPFEDQVAIAANATHIAGTAGSALHLVLFNGNPATKLIELRTKPARNQLIVNAIRGVDAYHIWCLKRRVEDRAAVLDIEVIERAMREIA